MFCFVFEATGNLPCAYTKNMSESKLRHLVSVRSDERVIISPCVTCAQYSALEGGGYNALRVYHQCTGEWYHQCIRGGEGYRNW